MNTDKPQHIREDIYGRANVADSPELLQYYKELQKYGADGLWTVANAIEPWQPQSESIPMIWRYKELRELVLKSADLVDPAKAGRRVVMLVNEGRKQYSACVGWLYTGLQTMRPGEITSAHRHMASALRFIMEGSGAYTVVDGHKIELNAHDFVLTPNGAWHDHGVAESGEQCVWQDGLDIPLMNALDVNFYDVYPQSAQSVAHPVNDLPMTWSGAGVTPEKFSFSRSWSNPYSPVMRFSFDKTYQALHDLAKASDPDPYDGYIVRYCNPLTGEHVMQTMGAHMQLLLPSMATGTHRHTGNICYQVAKGNGYSVIGEKKFVWQEKDIFVVPSWTFHQHVNTSDHEDACLFSFNDLPVMEKLGTYYEESLEQYQQAIAQNPSIKSSYQGRF